MDNYQRIRDLREDADKTQAEIADLLNMHLTTYRRYETSEREPPLYFVIELSKLYNVSIDYIAGLTNDKRGIGFAKQVNIKHNSMPNNDNNKYNDTHNNNRNKYNITQNNNGGLNNISIKNK